jgi:hypothetical protein
MTYCDGRLQNGTHGTYATHESYVTHESHSEGVPIAHNL